MLLFFSEIGIFGESNIAPAAQETASAGSGSDISQSQKRGRQGSRAEPEIRKAGRLGNDRPSLETRLGVGLSKPWGVWEGGFNERLGRPPAGMRISGRYGAPWKAQPALGENPFGYELRRRSNVFYSRNLTNAGPPPLVAKLHIWIWGDRQNPRKSYTFDSLDSREGECRSRARCFPSARNPLHYN